MFDRPHRLAAILLAALSLVSTARAQTTISWANAGTAFATGTNWTGGTAPANSLTTNIASFGTASPTQQPALASSRSVAGVAFASGAGAFTLSGTGTLTLGASGVNNATTTGTQTISLPLALGAAASFTNSGTLAISGAVNTAGFGLTLTGAGTGGTISGVVSGAGALTKSGTGTWKLSGANTFSGGTTLSAGTLAIQNASALGTGALTIAGGTLTNTSGSALTVTNNLVWSGDLTFTGNGAATSDLTLTPGTVSGTGNRTVTVSSLNTLTISSLWPDPNAGGLTKDGPGTLKLAGSNYGNGPYTINGGNLTFTSSAPFSSEASIVTLGSFDPNAARGTLVIDTTDNVPSTFNAHISGTGALIKTGSGTVVLEPLYDLPNTYSGGTTISGGTLAVIFDSALGAEWGFENGDAIANVTLAGGTLRADNTFTANRSMHVNDSGTIEVSTGSTLTWTGAIQIGVSPLGIATLTKTGGGTLYLTNAFNSDYVYITVSGGTLAGDTNGLLHYITNNATVKFDQSFDGSFGGSDAALIVGTGSVIKAGTGTVTFLKDNSYSGGTTLSGGTLAVSTNGRLGSASGPVTFSGGTLKTTGSFTAARATTLNSGGGTFLVDSATTLTWNGVIAGAAGNSLTKSGAGTLLLGGTNTYSGPTTISAGTLQLGSGGTAGSLGSGAIANNATLAIDRSNALTLANAISGTGALTKSGAGTLTLTGTVSAAGTTTVNAGTLQFAKEVSLYNNTTANWNAAKLIVNSGATAAFNVGGTGEFTATDIATLAALGTASGGFKSGSFLGFDTTNAAGGVFTYNTAILNPNGGANALGVVKLGTGTLLLGGANTYSGDTLVNAGTLKLGAANALSPNSKLMVAAGAFFDANGFAPVFSDLSGAGSLDVGSGGLAVAPSGTSSFTGVLSGTGGFTMSGSGTLTLGAANTFSGTTTISSGTVKLGAAGALPSGTPVTLASGATLDLNGNAASLGQLAGAGTVALGSANLAIAQSANSLFAGVLTGAGGLTKSGSGELELTGASSYTGGTLIAAGTVKTNNLSGSAFGTGAVTVASGATLTGGGSFSGALQNNGTFAPGNSPTLQNLSSFSQGSGGTLVMELGGLTRGTHYDALVIAGSFLPGGTLTLSLINGYNPASGATFDLFDFGSISGTFGTVNLPALGSGLTWDSSALYTTGVLSISGGSAIPEPSTYAMLLGVGALSLALWRRRPPN